MNPAASQRPRVLAVGGDAEVCAALHGALDRSGHALWCVPSPADLEPMLRVAAPQLVLLVLPALPDASWGTALATAATAARVGVRVVVIAPAREVVEPLAAVAGADRAMSRADVLARPESVLVRTTAAPAFGFSAAAGPFAPPAAHQVQPAQPALAPAPAPASPPVEPQQPSHSGASGSPPPAIDAPQLVLPESLVRPPRPPPDLAALIDEELDDEPLNRPRIHRVEVTVSLVSEHNFYVGATRRVDSGGVFISTAMPPPVGTRLQVLLGLADGRKMDLEGEVAFVRAKGATAGRQPAGCGVRLYGIPGWAVDAIGRFTQARPPIVYLPR